MLHLIELLYTGVRFLRSDFLCFSALNNDLFAAKEGNLYALTCKAQREQLSQGKGIGMLTDKHFFQKSLGNHRTGLFASTVLPLMVMLMIVQSVLPAYAATTRTALLSATLSSGCISPSDCVSKMTLPEKEGQMTQVEKNAFTMAGNSITDITTYFIGSVLSGGGGGPNGAGGTATQWADMVDNFQSYALQTRLGIPLIYGADAVHGHNNVYGATLFPHNIGLGAMHDPALITQVEQVTRDEVLGTGVRWTFAPCVCTPQDIRWGRTYEGYSEVPSDNATDGAAAIVGFQGLNGTLGPTNILATAKHFIGDGHTAWGTGSPYLNEGDAQISEQQLDTIGRVRRRCCHRPLPSELLVRVPPQAAQAFQMPSSGHGSTSVSPCLWSC
jgi:beta-glucosidase